MKIRLNLLLSEEMNNILNEIAESSSSNRTDVMTQAVALMKIAHSAKLEGKHIGFVYDVNKLDVEIIGLL